MYAHSTFTLFPFTFFLATLAHSCSCLFSRSCGSRTMQTIVAFYTTLKTLILVQRLFLQYSRFWAWNQSNCINNSVCWRRSVWGSVADIWCTRGLGMDKLGKMDKIVSTKMYRDPFTYRIYAWSMYHGLERKCVL